MSAPTQRWAYPVVLALLAVCLGVSGTPAPLYEVYADRWDFAPVTVTVVFAVYAATALFAVLFSGAISDRVGRKPVLLVAVALIVAGLVVFMLASATWHLVLARGLHGIGVGSAVVVGTAALLDVRPDDGERTGLRTGSIFPAGIGAAVLATTLLAEFAPRPLVLPYAAVLVVVAVFAVALLLMREPHQEDRTERLQIAWPRMPAEISAHFRFAALGVMAAWSVLGVFLSLYPAIAGRAVGAQGLLFGGTVVAVSSGAGALAPWVARRWPTRRGAMIGDLGTALFLVLAVPAVASGNGWLIAADSALLGFFFGLAFSGSLRHLTRHVPAGHRGEVMSAFYVLAYSALAVPTIAAGWAATVWDPETIFAPFMAVVAAACATAGLLGLRVRESEQSPAAAPDPAGVR